LQKRKEKEKRNGYQEGGKGADLSNSVRKNPLLRKKEAGRKGREISREGEIMEIGGKEAPFARRGK